MAMPEEWAELLADSAKPRPGAHVTDCLGCPRRKALLRDGVPVDLSRLERRLEGTILHWALAKAGRGTAEREVAGVLCGVPLVGSVDRLRGGRVIDFKNPDGKSRPSGAYPEQVWQMECYRRLLAMEGVETVGWTLWSRWKGEWHEFSHDGPVWSEEDLARFNPHGGPWTAGELAALTARVVAGEPAESIPMVGETQAIGSKDACAYCEVEGPCKSAPVGVEF